MFKYKGSFYSGVYFLGSTKISWERHSEGIRIATNNISIKEGNKPVILYPDLCMCFFSDSSLKGLI